MEIITKLKVDNFCIDNPFDNIFGNTTFFFKEFTNLLFLLLSYSKYIMIFIFFCLGAFSVLRSLNLSKINNIENISVKTNFKRNIDIVQLISGLFLIFIAFGFLTNILTLILIWLLDPFPDQFIYPLMKLDNIMEFLQETNSYYPTLQKLLGYICGIISFSAFLQITLSIWFMASHRFHVINPNGLIITILSGIVEGILFGFTTCFYFMIGI